MQDCENKTFKTSNLSWIVDSGATDHMCNDKTVFKSLNLATCEVGVAKEYEKMFAHGRGDVESEGFTLHDVLYVPDLTDNVISVHSLTIKDAKVNFCADKVFITTEKDIVLEGKKDSIYRLYYLNLKHIILTQDNNEKNGSQNESTSGKSKKGGKNIKLKNSGVNKNKYVKATLIKKKGKKAKQLKEVIDTKQTASGEFEWRNRSTKEKMQELLVEFNNMKKQSGIIEEPISLIEEKESETHLFDKLPAKKRWAQKMLAEDKAENELVKLKEEAARLYNTAPPVINNKKDNNNVKEKNVDPYKFVDDEYMEKCTRAQRVVKKRSLRKMLDK